MHKIKAAMVEPVGDHGGMNYFDFELCGSLAAAGVDVVLYTCCKTPPPPELQFEVQDHFSKAFAAGPRWRRAWAFVRGSLQSLLRARYQGCQLAHFHFFQVGVLQLLQVLLSRLLGLKVVISAHDIEPFDAAARAGRLDRWTYGLAHGLIAHNVASKHELVTRIGVDPNKIHIVRLGMGIEPAERLMPKPVAREHLGLDQDDFVILFFGQIKDVKGLDVLIDAVAKLRSRTSRPFRLVIAGRPWRTGFDAFAEQLARLGLEDLTTRHIRFIEDAEVESFYRSADIVALPYRRIYQSAVLLMAMRYRVPLIASDLPGMTEFVVDHVNGLVFKSESADSLAVGLQWAIEHPEALAPICEHAANLLETEFAWPKVGRDAAALYRRVCGQEV
jgi:glycosyltransferase involved in cell wall biosynthesis